MILEESLFFPSKSNTLHWTFNSYISLDSDEVIPTQISVNKSFYKFYHIFFKVCILWNESCSRRFTFHVSKQASYYRTNPKAALGPKEFIEYIQHDTSLSAPNYV